MSNVSDHALAMMRRIYFLFPEAEQSRAAVEDLAVQGVSREQIHAVAHPGVDTLSLPAASPAQRADRASRLERIAWNGNLVLFFVAVGVMLAALYWDALGWSLAAMAVMIVTFVLGLTFAVRIPQTRLLDQVVPLRHGEIVLMVDVPPGMVANVVQRVTATHPEVGLGGVGWAMRRVDV